MKAFGVDSESQARAVSHLAAPIFGVWAENLAPLTVLFGMRRQVRRAGMSGAVYGLDYNVLPLVMAQVGVSFDADGLLFAALQCAEDELVEFLAAR